VPGAGAGHARVTREQLLQSLAADAVAGPRVLKALGAVDRAAFVGVAQRRRAWEDCALPIRSGQTISQPRVVAHMCELLALEGHERVLDVGTGSGYHAAVLARLAAHVFTIERDGRLANAAAEALGAARVRNVTCLVGDGSLGVAAEAPFDAVNVAATAGPGALDALVAQLGPRGRLVAPERDGTEQLVVVRRTPDGVVRSTHGSVRFVPLIVGGAARSAPSRRSGR